MAAVNHGRVVDEWRECRTCRIVGVRRHSNLHDRRKIGTVVTSVNAPTASDILQRDDVRTDARDLDDGAAHAVVVDRERGHAVHGRLHFKLKARWMIGGAE